ncbi:tRNA 2'-phosphotransferase 1 [Scaptodrosophila lebanonensis]|uniref:2'-phosphotransferase n=1 Tax=Drosophila lebanonensis TaxID=7225 RepID=A0A6J2TBQ8_DROLE|nr:tRNA 2'-phosphotransferase 1 [Scaptodrosophila lebanonensis]
MDGLRLDTGQLDKQLTWLLRHGAQKEGLAIGEDGFVAVADILQHPMFEDLSLTSLKQIVASDNKQRYTLRRNQQNTAYEIRANQGHSLPVVQAEASLQRILEASEVPMAVHGIYYRNWKRIMNEGLKRFPRNQVHFAASDKLAKAAGGIGDNISGLRHDYPVLIYLNVAKVLADEIPLYRSTNNVILCAGVNGCITSSYFERVVDRRSGKNLML